ncbi:MAG: hypothetical protein KDF64_01530 [Geminicoccaceae bacterium]|nr:hypothetical protein [Geminicoccaceae bacterium]
MAETSNNAAANIQLPEHVDVCIASTPEEAGQANARAGIAMAQELPEIDPRSAIDDSPGRILHVSVPPEGMRVAYSVEAGMTVELARTGFDGATYTFMDGALVIEPAPGGTVVLEQFAAAAVAAPPLLLSVFGSEALPASSILAGFDGDTTDPSLVEPAAGPDGEAVSTTTGGGADFSGYDAGAMGPGMGVTGVLDPTALFRSVSFDDNRSAGGHGDGSGLSGSIDDGETGSGAGGVDNGNGNGNGSGNIPPVAEPDKVIILPDHAGSITMNTHAATDADGDTLTYELGELPDPSIAVITLGDGTPVQAGQILTESEYLSLHIDPSDGSAGSEFEFNYTVHDGHGGSDTGTMLVRLQDAAEGPWSEKGGDGHDVIRGSWGDDKVFAGGGDDYLKGGAGDDQLWGQAGDDRIHAAGGDDVLVGGAGHDELVGNEGDDLIIDDLAGIRHEGSQTRIQGGDGHDTLRIDGEGRTIDLTLIDNARIQNIEEIDLAGGGNRLVLDISEVLGISHTSDTLRISGSDGDAVAGDLAGAVVDQSDPGYTSYTFGNATLIVENTVDQSGIVV